MDRARLVPSVITLGLELPKGSHESSQKGHMGNTSCPSDPGPPSMLYLQKALPFPPEPPWGPSLNHSVSLE
jgi:hypothetical protein